MSFKTPPLHAKGVYQLKAPWVLPNNTLFECIAVREFRDFTAKGEKVFERVYLPKGLERSVYEADLAAGAKIITLYSDSLPLVLVPDSYIETYPLLNTVAYKSVVLSLNLGALPDTLDLTFLINQLRGIASDTLGTEPEVLVHAAPHTGVITQQQHDVIEAARQAAVTNRTTDRARVLELQDTNARLSTQLNNWEQIARNNGLIPQ